MQIVYGWLTALSKLAEDRLDDCHSDGDQQAARAALADQMISDATRLVSLADVGEAPYFACYATALTLRELAREVLATPADDALPAVLYLLAACNAEARRLGSVWMRRIEQRDAGDHVA